MRKNIKNNCPTNVGSIVMYGCCFIKQGTQTRKSILRLCHGLSGKSFRAVGERSVSEHQRHLFTIQIQRVCESRTMLHPLFHIAIFPGLCKLALELVMVVLGALPHTCKLFQLFPIARHYPLI